MSRLPLLALRNVGRNRRRSLVTGAAITIAVTMVMYLWGWASVMVRLMTLDAVEGRSGALQVHQKGFLDNVESAPTALNIPYTPELIAKMRAVPNIKGVTGRIVFTGLVSNGVSQTMVVGRGLDVAHEEEACPRAKAIVRPGGQPLESTDTTQALLGFELGESFGTRLLDTINVQSSSPKGRSNAIDLKVKGFTVSSFPFENKRVLAVPLATAQSLLDLDGRVTEYALSVHELEKLEETRQALQATLGPDYEVHTWAEMNTFVRDVLNRERVIVTSISVVLFVIALTVIANTMLMSVYERVREIGTLLAVGVRRRQVLQLFMLEAGFIGAFAGALGAAVGRLALFATASMHIVVELPGTSGKAPLEPMVSPGFVLGAVLLALLGAVVASALPARRAARLNPVDALRNA